MELQYLIYIYIILSLLFIYEINNTKGLSHYIFSFSKCSNEDIIRPFFLIIFYGCLIHAYLYSYLATIDYNGDNFLDFMGNGQKPTIGIFTSWEISHIVMYITYGYICPNDYVFALIVGIGFEILEFILNHVWNDMHITNYWSSGANSINTKDIIINMIGFFIGSFLSRLFKN